MSSLTNTVASGGQTRLDRTQNRTVARLASINPQDGAHEGWQNTNCQWEKKKTNQRLAIVCLRGSLTVRRKSRVLANKSEEYALTCRTGLCYRRSQLLPVLFVSVPSCRTSTSSSPNCWQTTCGASSSGVRAAAARWQLWGTQQVTDSSLEPSVRQDKVCNSLYNNKRQF